MTSTAYKDMMHAMKCYQADRTSENAVAFVHALERFDPEPGYKWREDWETFRNSQIRWMIEEFPGAFPSGDLPKFGS